MVLSKRIFVLEPLFFKPFGLGKQAFLKSFLSVPVDGLG